MALNVGIFLVLVCSWFGFESNFFVGLRSD